VKEGGKVGASGPMGVGLVLGLAHMAEEEGEVGLGSAGCMGQT